MNELEDYSFEILDLLQLGLARDGHARLSCNTDMHQFSNMLSWCDLWAPTMLSARLMIDLFQTAQILFRKSPLAGLQVTYPREL